MPSSRVSTTTTEPAWRRATDGDAVALRDLEQRASLAGLGHVFPPERFPYPEADVLARWHLVLADPSVVVEVSAGHVGLDDRSGPAVLLAYDAEGTLRHLAVDPASWGHGLGEAAVSRALAALRDQGLRTARLWCLAENDRARALYERLGWRVTGAEQEAPWPPYPREVEYTLTW